MNIVRTLPSLGKFLALALILAGTQAHAQSPIFQTQTQAYSGISNDAPGSLTFSTFDLSTGNTLTRVEVSLSGTAFTGYAQGTNTGTGDADLYVNLMGNLTVTASDNINYTIELVDTQNNGQTGVRPDDTAGPFSYANNPGKITMGVPTQTLFYETSDLRAYTSADGATIAISLAPNAMGVAGQAYDASNHTEVSADFSGSSTFGGNVSLVYTYTTPVPEPTTTAAWMIGFALCLIMGRRCFQRRSPVLL